MSTLHILSRAPSDTACWQDCLTACSEGDTLLLIENGVYGAQQRPATLPAQTEFVALQADADARGLSPLLHNSGQHAQLIDDAGFVARCVQHQQTVSWF